MRIIAGRGKKFEGSTKPHNDALTIGYLDREPELNEGLDVVGNLRGVVAPLLGSEERYNEVVADMEGA